MKRITVFAFVAFFITGCVSGGISPPTSTASAISSASVLALARDGHYDNNTFLVNPQRMNLDRAMESLYPIRTVLRFKLEGGLKVWERSIKGTGIALFGKYLLTVEHVVSVEKASATPYKDMAFKVMKMDERTYLEYGGRSYALERMVVDEEKDVALFRIPEGLKLKSFPYRIGNSDDLRVGNFVYLIGNPMNFGINVREGIVSSLKTPKAVSLVNSVAQNAFMVSNGLNPGDSGAPVIAIRDGNPELVGLAQGSFTASQRLGWVIGINVVTRLLKEKAPEFGMSLKNE